MNFITILSADDAPLRGLLTRIEGVLLEAGFKHEHSIMRAAYDAGRKVFDEVFPDEEVRVHSGFAELPESVSLWEGLSCEFWNDSFMLYLLIGRVGQGAYVNVWIDIELRALAELLANQEERAFYGALASICAAIGAQGGYGHTELAFHPLSPARARTAFLDMPELPGESSLLGLLPAGESTEVEVRKKCGSIFTPMLSTQGYWILTQNLVEILVS